MLHTDVITDKTLVLLKTLMAVKELEQTRLAGGTALALQIGHRKSDDLDFFGLFDCDRDLSEVLPPAMNIERTGSSRTIQFYNINGIKTDFVRYEYPWLKEEVTEGNIRLASLEDIAALKVNAIIGRGTRKDFIDLYYLLRMFPLRDILSFYTEKYGKKSNIQLALRSLVYFDDAESEPMPYLLGDFDWAEAVKTISSEVRRF